MPLHQRDECRRLGENSRPRGAKEIIALPRHHRRAALGIEQGRALLSLSISVHRDTLRSSMLRKEHAAEFT